MKRYVTIAALVLLAAFLIFQVSEKQGRSKKVADFPLEGTAWFWMGTVSPDGALSAPLDPTRFPLHFDAGSYGSGTDCNYIKGSYAKDGEVLSLTPPELSSHQQCKPANKQDEYMKHLALATSYYITGDQLTIILYKDAGAMAFRASR